MATTAIGGQPVLLAIVLVLLGHAFWRFLTQHRDRFVVTNMRVMRIRGVFSQTVATTPIARILDITLKKPIIGRMLRLRPLRLRVGRAGPGFPRDQVGQPARRPRPDHPARHPAHRPAGVRERRRLQGDDDSDDDGTGPIGMDSAQEVSATTPAPAAASDIPSTPPGPRSASKSIFNSERGNWTDNE